MAHEHWRAAVTRWGDPTLELALLLTNQPAAAIAAAETVLARTIPTAPAQEIEATLYRELLHLTQRPRQRLARALRRGKLPRILTRVAPLDRFLLGLWLRRGLDSAQISAASGLAESAVVARLAAVVDAAAQPIELDAAAGHLTLESWVSQQLGVPAPHADHPRPCRACQAAQAAWSDARDTLRGALRDALRQVHLPLASYDAIEDAILSGQDARQRSWWRDPRLAIAGTVGVVALVLALLLLPQTGSPDGETAAALQPSPLVDDVLAKWGQNSADQPLHLHVWAHDPRLHNGEPVVTDVWVGEQGSPRHRVEVRRNGRLVEWQFADGRARFDYAAEPADSSCSWNVGIGGRRRRFLERVPVRFSITPAQQRAALDARLREGAYGIGYEMLLRAKGAEDLRSFGTRVEGQATLVLLRYTDTATQPARQIVLRVDADTHQLRGVQEVLVVGNQATTTDLWRLDGSELAPGGVPPNNPDGPDPLVLEQLLDASCPPLDPEAVISPRALLPSDRPWYVPQELPEGITSLALLTTEQQPGRGIRITPDANSATLMLQGPQRWFALGLASAPNDGNGAPAIAGRWQVFLGDPSADGLWRGQLRLNGGDASAFGPTLDFSGRGWSRDELLALLATIGPFDTATLQTLGDAFLDANPLPPQAAHIFTEALAALHPEPGQTLEITSTTKVRVPPDTVDLVDPYHFLPVQRYPAVVVRFQQLSYESRHIAQYQDRQTLPDGSLHEERRDDGERFSWYSNLRGIDYTGDARYLRAVVVEEPVDAELLGTLFGTPAQLAVQDLGDELLVEQTLDGPPESVDTGGPAPTLVPWTGDLPSGTWVRQLWIDARSFRPLAAAVTLREPGGTETRVEETTIDERRVLSGPPPARAGAAAFVSVDVSGPNQGFTADVAAPTRMLDWPAGGDVLKLDRSAGEQLDPAHLMPSASWFDLSSLAGTVRARYRAADGTPFQIVQGPGELLRFVLKHQDFQDLSAGSPAWQTSQRVPITVGGAATDAWLLADPSHSVLVFEIDELLVQVSAPADYLTGPLLELLPRLAWQPI